MRAGNINPFWGLKVIVLFLKKFLDGGRGSIDFIEFNISEHEHFVKKKDIKGGHQFLVLSENRIFTSFV